MLSQTNSVKNKTRSQFAKRLAMVTKGPRRSTTARVLLPVLAVILAATTSILMTIELVVAVLPMKVDVASRQLGNQNSPEQQLEFSQHRRRQVLRNDYDAFNRLLVERVASDEALDNVLEAADWLKLLAKPSAAPDDQQVSPAGRQHQEAAKVSKNTRRELELINKLQQIHLGSLLRFTSLLKLLADELSECNLVGRRILTKNIEALSMDIMVAPSRLGPMRRIERVVRQVAQVHADGCKQKYPELLVWARRNAHNELGFQHIERMMLDLIEVQRTKIQIYWSNDDDANNLVGLTNINSLRDKPFAIVLYRILENLGSDDTRIGALQPKGDPTRQNSWTLDEQTIRNLADDYLFKQCEWLIRVTGNVAKSALSDQRLYEPEDQYKKIDKPTRQLMFYMGYFRVCELMLGPDRQHIEKNLINLSWDIVKGRPFGKRDTMSLIYNVFRG